MDRDEAQEAHQVKEATKRAMLDHLVRTGANVATPADPAAKVRRSVLRGLRD